MFILEKQWLSSNQGQGKVSECALPFSFYILRLLIFVEYVTLISVILKKAYSWIFGSLMEVPDAHAIMASSSHDETNNLNPPAEASSNNTEIMQVGDQNEKRGDDDLFRITVDCQIELNQSRIT